MRRTRAREPPRTSVRRSTHQSRRNLSRSCCSRLTTVRWAGVRVRQARDGGGESATSRRQKEKKGDAAAVRASPRLVPFSWRAVRACTSVWWRPGGWEQENNGQRQFKSHARRPNLREHSAVIKSVSTLSSWSERPSAPSASPNLRRTSNGSWSSKYSHEQSGKARFLFAQTIKHTKRERQQAAATQRPVAKKQAGVNP